MATMIGTDPELLILHKKTGLYLCAEKYLSKESDWKCKLGGDTFRFYSDDPDSDSYDDREFCSYRGGDDGEQWSAIGSDGPAFEWRSGQGYACREVLIYDLIDDYVEILDSLRYRFGLGVLECVCNPAVSLDKFDLDEFGNDSWVSGCSPAWNVNDPHKIVHPPKMDKLDFRPFGGHVSVELRHRVRRNEDQRNGKILSWATSDKWQGAHRDAVLRFVKHADILYSLYPDHPNAPKRRTVVGKAGEFRARIGRNDNLVAEYRTPSPCMDGPRLSLLFGLIREAGESVDKKPDDALHKDSQDRINNGIPPDHDWVKRVMREYSISLLDVSDVSKGRGLDRDEAMIELIKYIGSRPHYSTNTQGCCASYHWCTDERGEW